MNFALLVITNLLAVSVLGTFAAGVLAICFRSRVAVRGAQIILMLAAVAGAGASIFFLLNGWKSVSGDFWGINFYFDTLSAIFFLVLNVAAFFAHLYSIGYLAHTHHYHVPSLVFFTALFVGGMQSVLLTATPIEFMIAWEVMSVSSFFLILADKKPESMKAAMLYIAMTHISAMGILAGFFFSGINAFTDFHDFKAISGAVAWVPFTFFFFGFGLKAGLVPLHVWLPAAHPQAPSHISALLSGVMLKMAVYAFLRFLFLYHPELPEYFGIAVLGIGLVSAIFGVLYAVIEKDFKRLLAFSSTENLGIIFVMIGAGILTAGKFGMGLSNPFFAVAVFQSAVHAFFKTGLFLTAGVAVETTNSRSLEQMGGMAKKFPYFGGGFLMLALAAAAIPPFGAFFGEWALLQNILSVIFYAPNLTKIAFLAVVPGIAFVSGVAIYTMGKLFGISMLGLPRSESVAKAKTPDFFLVFPVVGLGIISLVMGVVANIFLPLHGALSLDSVSKCSVSKCAESTAWPIPLAYIALFLVILLGIFLIRQFFGNRRERVSTTWNCGHPLTPQMQFSAAAMSAPIAFFFRPLLWVKKSLIRTKLVESNEWMVKNKCSIHQESLWNAFIYDPLVRFVMAISARAAGLQNGVVQFYLGLIFLTLLLVLIIIAL